MTLSNSEYFKQGDALLEGAVKRVKELIKTFPSPRREAVQQMLDGQMGLQFMTAPASIKRSFHNAFPHGLLLHSLNVVDAALKISSALAPGRWPIEKLTFCALFHDFGKSGSLCNPYYIECQERWKLERGEFYTVNKNEFMPNSERSCWLLQKFGILLEYDEFAAIRLNDGMGPRENQAWSFHEPELALIIHWADHWAMRLEKSLDQ